MRLEPQRHQRLGGLPAETLFVGQKVIFDELLRQGTSALHHATSPEVRPECAHDTVRVDAVMLVKSPILDQFNPRTQQRRDIIGRQDEPVLAVDWKYTADHGRIEAEHGQLRAIGPCQARNQVWVRIDRDELGLALFVDEARAARMEIERAAAPSIDPGSRERVSGVVMEAAQFLFEIIG